MDSRFPPLAPVPRSGARPIPLPAMPWLEWLAFGLMIAVMVHI